MASMLLPIAWITLFIIPIFLMLWILVDSSFGIMLDVVLIDLKLRDDLGIDMRGVHSPGELGGRIALLVVLAIAALICVSIFVVFCVSQHRTSLSLRSLFLTMTLLCVWLALFGTYHKLLHWGLIWRVWTKASAFESIGQKLVSCWPTTNGHIDFVGEYNVDSESPRHLITTSSKQMYPIGEVIGPFIRFHSKERVSFDLAAQETWLVNYCVDERPPTSFADQFSDLEVRYTLKRSVRITDRLYLNQYEVEGADKIEPITESTNP